MKCPLTNQSIWVLNANMVLTRLLPTDFFQRLLLSDFIRKVSGTFATRALLIGIGLITTVIVARVLGPEGRGLYAVALAISTIGVQFGNLGLHASNTYYVAKNPELLPALIGNTLVISFGVGTLIGVLIWLTFFLWPNLAPLNKFLLILSLVWIPFGLAYLLIQNLLLGIGNVRAFNLIELFSKLLGIALIGLVLLSDKITVERVFLASFFTLVISFVWALWQLESKAGAFPLPSFSLFKENIFYGLKAYLAAFFAFIVLKVDLLMIQYLLGKEQAGYYSIAVTMADMVISLPVVIGTILFPKLSAMSDQCNKWEFTKKMAKMVTGIMIIVTTSAVLLGKPVVQFLFGNDFAPAVPAFNWLLPGIFLISVNIILMNYFASVGIPNITIYSPAAAMIINIILNLMLIPNFGIVGASISSTVSYGIMFSLSIIYTCCRHNK